MKKFRSRHGEKIIGVLSGFDRIVFRGTLRQLAHVSGLSSFLTYKGVMIKDFATYAEEITKKIRTQTAEIAQAANRPLHYLHSSQLSKEEMALSILKRKPVESGLICVLWCVEPCMSCEVHRNREQKRIDLQFGIRKCLHFYHYFLDPELGLMHARLQTWFPFTMQICLNGREWLAHQMDRAGIAYKRRDNCFVWVEDVAATQRLMDRQLRTHWPRLLDGIRERVHPLHPVLFKDAILPYYWSVHQMEWATDVMFDRPPTLAAIYPHLTRHAITQFSSTEVMRFLGRKVHPNFEGEIVSDYRTRDLRVLLYPQASGSATEKKRAAARITRLLTILRGHKLIRKLPHTHRYQLTTKGRQIITAILAAREAEVASLLKAAA